jgi:maleylacetate reductase
MARIARSLGAPGDAPAAMFDLATRHGAPTSLAAIGMRAENLDRATDLALQNEYPNPRPLERGAIRALLQRALDGARPA